MRFGPYVGIPNILHGRSVEGADCWGLITLIYFNELGIVLPSHHDDYMNVSDKKALQDLIDQKKSKWTYINRPNELPFDLILLSNRGFNSHVGMVIGKGKFIHMSDRQAEIDNYRSFVYQRRIVGFYRYDGIEFHRGHRN